MGNLCCCIKDVGRGKINVSPAIQTQQPPYIECEKPATIRNDVNLRKETLTLRPDPENPGQLLVSFSFDATVRGRITVVFFAEEDSEFNLTATKEATLPPITFDFEKVGLGQEYIQPSGTGVDLYELFKEEVETCIYPLAVKIEAAPEEGSSSSTNAQITRVTFAKENGEVKPSVMKQFLWVNGSRYELQDIYGIENTVDAKECVVCLSEPRDTIVLPCRHMCMCSGCAKALRFQKNECPVCRQPAERLVELEGNGNINGDEHI
ncbi:E3 ubiquitin-protein ligase LUL1 [Hirschfeldia incana]|nr:E3 ubiquitin-protein ligase LUL1 [Hirschfeldia incana]